MGIGPFVAITKLPKRRLSAEERLCRLEETKAYLRQHLTAHPVLARGAGSNQQNMLNGFWLLLVRSPLIFGHDSTA